MPRIFSVRDVVLSEPGLWRVRIGFETELRGRVFFAGSAVELVAELNGRQRAVFGNALEGRLQSLQGLVLEP